jgi:hypothetical protein
MANKKIQKKLESEIQAENQGVQISRKTLTWTIIGAVAGVLSLWLFLLNLLYGHLRADLSQDISTSIGKQLEGPNGQIASLGSRISKIEGNIEILEPQIRTIIESQLKKAATLPTKEFEENLPTLHKTLRAAKLQEVKIDSKLIELLSYKLSKSSSQGPVYWPTTAEFIGYRSVNLTSSWVRQASLPECTNSLPKPMTVKSVESPTKMTVNRALYENCRFTLDSPEDDRILNTILQETAPLITFRKCVIDYGGGEIHLILAWNNVVSRYHVNANPPGEGEVSFSGNALEFEDCLFDFSLGTSPPPKGQEIVEALLSQTSKTLKLPYAP